MRVLLRTQFGLLSTRSAFAHGTRPRPRATMHSSQQPGSCQISPHNEAQPRARKYMHASNACPGHTQHQRGPRPGRGLASLRRGSHVYPTSLRSGGPHDASLQRGRPGARLSLESGGSGIMRTGSWRCGQIQRPNSQGQGQATSPVRKTGTTNVGTQ